MKIRQETQADYGETERLVEEAFQNLELSQHNEQILVQRLRESKEFVPELSLVAETDNKIVGQILLSKITIAGESETESLVLAPVSVLPEYQGQGVGGTLIREGLKRAKDLGFESVVLVGHSTYYPRFGFERASKWNLKCSFEVPDEVFMAIELKKDSLSGKGGTIRFSDAFELG